MAQTLSTSTSTVPAEGVRADGDAAREHPTQPLTCPMYRDCNDPTPGHYDHSGHGVLKVLDERDTSTVIDAGMVSLSTDDPHATVHATVYIGVAEYSDPAALKAKTQELRRFLDEVDALADRVFADHQARA
ncbi:hypothetical protein [Streptomyces sp. GbtcB6]|uniref:hypothetical protein n=1 Tax=Streptomyces sp. GbtcB6 TaxID=2824751 RepID=UPI001C2F9D7A|nr:hypothetical protein [Streptomyces sp. GbtcB6]